MVSDGLTRAQRLLAAENILKYLEAKRLTSPAPRAAIGGEK